MPVLFLSSFRRVLQPDFGGTALSVTVELSDDSDGAPGSARRTGCPPWINAEPGAAVVGGLNGEEYSAPWPNPGSQRA